MVAFGLVHRWVDINLFSFDATSARSIIAMYEEMGVPKDRILIKLAGTWEGEVIDSTFTC